MMGIKGPGRGVSEERSGGCGASRLAGQDLRRIGVEVPQQLARVVFDGRRGNRSHHAGRSAADG